MNRRYVVLYGQQGHPLSKSNGELFEHRAVLYEKVGPGTHPCHFCQTPVMWQSRRPGTTKGALHVEHLDGNTTNNAPENLVPSCQPCNVTWGFRSDRIREDELTVVRGRGRTRAITVVCAHCDKPFLAVPSNHAQFCSRRCADDAKRRTVCRRGHPRSGDNLTKFGQCRECNRLALARYRDKQRAAKRSA